MKRKIVFSLIAGAALFLQAQTITLQQGVDGYSGAEDNFSRSKNTTTDWMFKYYATPGNSELHVNHMRC